MTPVRLIRCRKMRQLIRVYTACSDKMSLQEQKYNCSRRRGSRKFCQVKAGGGAPFFFGFSPYILKKGEGFRPNSKRATIGPSANRHFAGGPMMAASDCVIFQWGAFPHPLWIRS